MKCPDGRVTRNQDAFEPHAVRGIHLVVPLLEPREQEIRRSLGTSSLPRRLHQTALLKSPLPYFGGTGTSPSSAFFRAVAASLRRVRLVSRNSGLPIVPVAQTGFLVALRREEGDRGAFDHFADELRDRKAGATDERLGHGEEARSVCTVLASWFVVVSVGRVAGKGSTDRGSFRPAGRCRNARAPLLPEPEMAQNALDDILLVDEPERHSVRSLSAVRQIFDFEAWDIAPWTGWHGACRSLFRRAPGSRSALCRFVSPQFLFRLNAVSLYDRRNQSWKALVDFRASRRVVHLDASPFATN